MVICRTCEADIPADSKFCPKCGQPVEGEVAQGTQNWREWRYERHAWRHARRGECCGGRWSEGWGWSWMWSPFWIMVNAVIFGLGVTLVGTLLFLASSGVTGVVTWENFWAFLLIGLGTLGVIRETAKFIASGHTPLGGGMIFAIILIIIGVAGLAAQSAGWSQYWWIFIIVGCGLAIVAMGIFNYFWMKARVRK